MKPNTSPAANFDKNRATSYDEQRSKLAPMKDALHLMTRLVLVDLPKDAHILCVGVGTGAELFDLAHHNSKWRFTAVDPAAPMLEVCQEKAKEQDFTSRCTFHEGYLDTLPRSGKFNAATCFLVSHFLTEPGEREALITEIGSRLLPNGILVNADISGDMSEPYFESLLAVWRNMMRYSDIADVEVEKMVGSLGVNIAVSPPGVIGEMIENSGFDSPILFFQSLLIHAWYSRLGT